MGCTQNKLIFWRKWITPQWTMLIISMAWIRIPTRDSKKFVYTQNHMVIEFVYKKSNKMYNFVGQYYFKNLRYRFAFFLFE